MIRKKILMAVILPFVVSGVNAVVSPDKTRAAFGRSEKSMMFDVSNGNKQLPYLAQAWIENENQEEIITGPVTVTLLVQHLESGTKSMVRLSIIPDISKLPQDRGPLFYLNLREIPPRSERANVLQIALQTKIKPFYRPVAIKTRLSEVRQGQSILNKVSGGYRIENLTPYYVTIIGLGGSERQAEEDELGTVILSPRSEQAVRSTNYNTPYLSYISDYGGRPVLSFIYDGNRCSMKKEKQRTVITAKCGWDTMVVNRIIAALYLIALSLSGSIHAPLRTEERGIYDDVSTIDESRRYRINERGGRTGSLTVSDALPPSSCTLVGNEVPLSPRPENHSASTGAPLTLRLTECGDGGALQSGKRGVATTVSGSLVTGPGTGSTLLPDRKLSSCDHLVIHDDDTFLLCRLTRRQGEMLAAWRKRATLEDEYSDARSNPAMLCLSIKYE